MFCFDFMSVQIINSEHLDLPYVSWGWPINTFLTLSLSFQVFQIASSYLFIIGLAGFTLNLGVLVLYLTNQKVLFCHSVKPIRHGICHKWHLCKKNLGSGKSFQELSQKNNFSVKFAKLRRNFAQNDWSDIVFEWEFVKRLTICPKHPTFSIFAKHVAIYAFFR